MAKQTKERKVKARDDNGKPICGAKTRSGGVCRNKPMENGRCRYHGGKTPGAPIGNQNARKHGLYSEYYTDEEAQQIGEIKLGSVEDELKLCRIKLRRWLKYQNEIDQKLDQGEDEAGMKLEEKETEQIVIKENDEPGEPATELPAEKVKFKRKRINIEDNIDRLLRRIESLERTRHMLLLADDGHDYEAELRKQLDEDK
jgi:uncharacterized protein YjcR